MSIMPPNDKYSVVIRDAVFSWDKVKDDNKSADKSDKKDGPASKPAAVVFKNQRVDFSVQVSVKITTKTTES